MVCSSVIKFMRCYEQQALEEEMEAFLKVYFKKDAKWVASKEKEELAMSSCVDERDKRFPKTYEKEELLMLEGFVSWLSD